MQLTPILVLAIGIVFNVSAQDNDQYPELSNVKITRPTGDTITLTFTMPGIALDASEHDPACFTLTKLNGSNCKRACADLPSGQTFSEVTASGFGHAYARFAEREVYPKGGYERVCYKVKNWGRDTGASITIRFKAKT